MKKWYIVCLLGVICLGIWGMFNKTSLTDKLYPEKPIHVFYEGLASMPALLQMTDIIKLPPDELKIFSWHRFSHRAALVDLKKINAIEVNYKEREGYSIINGKDFIKKVMELLNDHPKSPVIIYTNLNNYKFFLKDFLPLIPKERVKHLHLYEDGLGELLTYPEHYKTFNYTDADVMALNNLFYGSSGDENMPESAKYMLHNLFLTTYHLYGINEVKNNPNYKHFFSLLKGANLKDINFKKIRKSLSEEEIKLLFRFVNFDNRYYQKLFSENKVFIFFGGLHFWWHHHKYHAEAVYLKSLMDKYPDYKFLFKPHPSFSSYDRSKIFEKYFPTLEIVNAQLPYEIFELAGLTGDKFAGAASSLFYNLSDEKIEGYIPHKVYSTALNQNRNLKEKEIAVDKYLPNEPLVYDERIITDKGDDYLIFMSERYAYLWQKRLNYLFIKKDDILYLYLDKKGLDTYKKQDGKYVPVSGKGVYLKHEYWEDFFVPIETNRYCRLQGDCAKVEPLLKKLSVCWDNWGCETFEKKEKNVYVLVK